MNYSPLIFFAAHHASQLAALAGKGSAGNARKYLDLAYAVTPWLLKHYPQINEQRLWEDALDMVENMLSADTAWKDK